MAKKEEEKIQDVNIEVTQENQETENVNTEEKKDVVIDNVKIEPKVNKEIKEKKEDLFKVFNQSEKDGLTETIKVINVPFGCLVKSLTESVDKNGVKVLAESMTYIPHVNLNDKGDMVLKTE